MFQAGTPVGTGSEGGKFRMAITMLRSFTAAMLLAACVSSSPRVALGAQSNRQQAEREIRAMISELGYAQKTGDVETVKKLTARRALALYRFAFNALLSKMLAPASPGDAPAADEGDEALSFFIRMGGEATGKVMTPEEVKAAVRAEAERPITFVDDRTARVYGSEREPAAFAVFEDGRWKMDDTELVKAALLDLDKGGSPGPPVFTPEQRERIKKF
jgi:hypothetical protein